MLKGEVVVSHVALAGALSDLLGGQWDDFAHAAPHRRDLVPASHAFAAAAGFPCGDPLDKAWGSIPRLLSVLETWPTAVESDLQRFWGIDYRDRWRGGLTLRQIAARLSHLPADSALAVTMGRRSPTELLLMDIYEPLAGRAHPSRPMTPQQIAERNAKAEEKSAAIARYEARKVDRLATARANAQRMKGS